MTTANNLPFYFRRKVYIPTLIALLLFVFVLVGAPYGIEYGFKRQMLKLGADRVSIEDIDFNPFSGILTISHLKVEQEGEAPLLVGKANFRFIWHKLFQKQLVLSEVRLSSANMAVQLASDKQWRFSGMAFNSQDTGRTSEKGSIAWGFAVESVEFQNVSVDLVMPEIKTRLVLNKLQLTNLTSIVPEEAASISLDARLDGSSIVTDGKMNFFSDTLQFHGLVKWGGIILDQYRTLLPADISQLGGVGTLSGDLSIQYTAGTDLSVSYDGRLSLTDISMKNKSRSLASESFEWAGLVKVYNTGARDAEVELSGDVRLRRAVFVSAGTIDTKFNSIDWSGSSALMIDTEGDITASMKGDTHVEQFYISSSQYNAELYSGQVSWKGDVNISSQTDSGSVGVDAVGNLVVDAFKALSTDENYALMVFDRSKIHGVNVNVPDQYSIDRLEFDSLQIGSAEAESQGAQDNAVVHYGNLSVSGVQYETLEGININHIQQNDVTQTIRRSDKGEWNAIRLVDMVKTVARADVGEVSEQSIEAEASKTSRIRIGQISVSDNSKVVFEDQHVKPVFRQEVKISKVTVASLDTRQPEKKSPFELLGVVGKRSQLSLKGSVSPFSPKLTIDIQGRLDAFPLPPLSSYTSGLIGYTLDSGEVNVKTDFKADKGLLDIKNELTMHQVDVTPLSAEQAKRYKDRKEVPLESGLAVLRDKNNNIKLNLPITGDVGNFKIDPSDIINQALGKAMKQAAKSYISAALFPYGLLLTVAEVAGEKAMQIKLDPIVYTPGSAELSKTHKDYLDKVAKILDERPEMHIKLCGVSTLADEAALTKQAVPEDGVRDNKKENEIKITDEQMISLAEQRAENIEALLVQEYEIQPDRLVSCKARYAGEEEKSQEPRTELSI